MNSAGPDRVNALDVANIYKYYGDFAALRDIGFRVSQGLHRGAAWEETARGKRRSCGSSPGFRNRLKANVRVLGADARQECARRRIGVLGHGISLYDELTATENPMLFCAPL